MRFNNFKTRNSNSNEFSNNPPIRYLRWIKLIFTILSLKKEVNHKTNIDVEKNDYVGITQEVFDHKCYLKSKVCIFDLKPPENYVISTWT